METYEVEFKETKTFTVTVEAENADTAMEYATEEMHHGQKNTIDMDEDVLDLTNCQLIN